MRYRIVISVLVAMLALCGQAFGQSSILQGGAWTPGRSPMYVGSGQSQPVVQDSGPASGGAIGLGLAEQLLTVRNPANIYPAANIGSGPFGTNWCDYDAPVTNQTGYHVLCLGPNSSGGGMIYYDAGGGASQLPFQFWLNGTTYQFPFVVGGIVGPGTTTIGDIVCWNNITGTLVKSCPPITTAQIAANAVDNTKLATMPANTVKCNPTNSTGAAQDCPVVQQVSTRSVTGNDTATVADCGKTIVATGGFNTMNLPSAVTVGSGCRISYRNNEVYSGIGTARGKKMSGFPSDFTTDGRNILYPNQTGQVISDGTNWLTLVRVGPWFLSTSAELCVRQDGDNTSDGLGNGTVASGCLSSIQTAVVVIGEAWNGLGYNPCNIGLYAGGTSIFNESVSATGQSIGCYLTFNIRGTITWTGPLACLTIGDNGIAIVNWTFGFVPTFSCNSTNTVSTGQFKGHQTAIFDFNGGTGIWLPGGNPGVNTGSNDVFLDLDLQGSATYNATINVGDAIHTFAPLAFGQCEAHCQKITWSGSVAFSPFVTFNTSFVLKSGSVMTSVLTWPGVTSTNPTVPTGGSNLITNGTTIPGGTTPSAPVSGCAQNAFFGLVCLTAL